jgi:hypothetical protein
VVLVLVPGGYYDPVFAKPPDILGVPLGLVVAGIAMLWMLIGLAMVWRARTRSVEFIALVVFAIPATIVIVLAPPLILIMQNLG